MESDVLVPRAVLMSLLGAAEIAANADDECEHHDCAVEWWPEIARARAILGMPPPDPEYTYWPPRE